MGDTINNFKIRLAMGPAAIQSGPEFICRLAFGEYDRPPFRGADRNMFVMLENWNTDDKESGYWERFATLSVNIEGTAISDEYFCAKTYSENAGLCEQVEALGLIRHGGIIIGGFPQYRLTEKGLRCRDEYYLENKLPPTARMERDAKQKAADQARERIAEMTTMGPDLNARIVDWFMNNGDDQLVIDCYAAFEGDWEDNQPWEDEDACDTE